MAAAAGALVLAGLLALILASPGGQNHPETVTAFGRLGKPPWPLRIGPLRPGPPAQPPPRTEQLGVNIGLLFSLRIYGQALIYAQLSALARTGATLVRFDAPWEAAEPAPPVHGIHYDWRLDDRIASALAAHHLQWLPIIDYSPPWVRSVRGLAHSAPSSAAAYAAYAGALAARYGTGGTFWRAHPELPPEPVQTYEIWNEPDSALFWQPRPDPAAYARLYLRARVAITSVQPTARVIVGGLTNPRTFLPELLSAEPMLRGHIDGVAIHPYGHDPEAVLARVRAARLALRSLGMGSVPLYVTEFGWSTQPAGGFGFAPANLRPRFIYETMAALRHTDCGLAAVLLYAWFTPELNPANKQDWFGIDPPRPGPSPAVRAFSAALRGGVASPANAGLCSG